MLKANRSSNKTVKSKKTAVDRLMVYVKASEGPPLVDQYGALLGTARPVDVPLASHTELLKEGAKEAFHGLGSSIVRDGAEIQFQVSRIAVRRLDDLIFPIVDARKVATEYGKRGYDGIAGVRLSPLPDADTGEAKIALDVVAIYSADPNAPPSTRLRKKQAALGYIQRSGTETFSLNDTRKVKEALAAIFYPPLTRLPPGDDVYDEKRSFAKGSVQGERALVALMCRSQLPISKMLIGFGAGQAVVKSVNAHIDQHMKEACKGKAGVLHRDHVPHFWFDELRRLGLDHLSVPRIKLR